jgi:hypothetical protein
MLGTEREEKGSGDAAIIGVLFPYIGWMNHQTPSRPTYHQYNSPSIWLTYVVWNMSVAQGNSEVERQGIIV